MDHDVLTAVLGALLVISEAIGGIKSINESSIYQVVFKYIKKAHDTIIGSKPKDKPE